MGSGSSRMGSRPTRPRSDHRPKLNFAAFLCGGASTSSSPPPPPPQIEGQQSEKLTLPAKGLQDSMSDYDIQSRVKESPFTSSESSSSCSLTENFSSSPSIDNSLMENSTMSQNADTKDPGKYSSESKELVPCLSSGSSVLDISHSKRTRNVASTSSKPARLEPLSTNINTNFILVNETSDPINDLVSLPSDTSETEIHATGSTSRSASISLSTSNLLVEEPLLEANSSDADFLSVGERRDGNILHVDVVSISSNILPSGTGDVNGNETRRNSRRQFWDAFSRRNRTRRNYDYPGLEDHDDIGSHDRWLLDIGDDLFGSRFDYDSVYLHRRSHGSSGRRWHSRSEIREQLRGGFQNDRRDTTFCPSGLHPNGTCSCNSLFMNEESSTRASISRIVLLAEALFEVLDEIHRQPVSLSLSMVSLPAPESVVNSLPVKSHIKHDAAAGTTDDVEQCYICLAEYEEGDKIRVLPCRHEYHRSCVDKWLKEIHGVCPLCRRDVCEGTAEITSEVTMRGL